MPMSRSTNSADALTLIITTSPTPSAPSTELLANVFESFRQKCPALLQCRLIIVFDTYEAVSDHARLKKGRVTSVDAAAFELYKANVKKLVHDQSPFHTTRCFEHSTGQAEFGSPGESSNHILLDVLQSKCKSLTYIEPQRRLGFGLAVRSALRLATTPYVWLHQHDWTLTVDIPLESILQVMATSEVNVPVKYVCFPSIRLLSYAVQHDTLRFPELRALTIQLKQDFNVSGGTLPLTPLFLWHDKPHIANREHYLARMFPSRYGMKRGDFIEDTIGQRARSQMKQGQWHKWATWLYYPENGKQLCVHHLKGRVWRGVEGEERQKALWIAIQKANGLTQASIAHPEDTHSNSVQLPA